MGQKSKLFLLSELPDYDYPLNVACPECYRPLSSRKRVDGRCDNCLKDKKVLPVNYLRSVKKKTDEEEDDYRSSRYDEE